MAVKTVTTTAQALVASDDNRNNGSSPGQVVIQNTGASDLYVGSDADVTADANATTGGLIVAANETLGLSLPAGRALYGITTSSAVVRVLIA